MAKTRKKAKRPVRRRTRITKRWKPLPRSKATNAYELLEDVCKVILEEPKRYYQGDWALGPKVYGYRTPKEAAKEVNMSNVPACGTVCCVAGWVVALAEPKTFAEITKTRRDEMPYEAGRILGVDSPHDISLHDSIGYLFDGAALEKMVRELDLGIEVAPPKTKEYAKLGVRRIRHFMEEHEAGLKAHKLGGPGD